MKIGPRYALVYSKVQPTEEANLGSEHETKKRACTQVHYVRKVLYVTQKNTAEPGKCWYNTACCPGVHPYPHPQKLLKMEPRLKCELVWRLLEPRAINLHAGGCSSLWPLLICRPPY